MTAEHDDFAQVFSPQDIACMDTLREQGEDDLLAGHILNRMIRRSDLFSGTVPKTPIEIIPETSPEILR